MSVTACPVASCWCSPKHARSSAAPCFCICVQGAQACRPCACCCALRCGLEWAVTVHCCGPYSLLGLVEATALAVHPELNASIRSCSCDGVLWPVPPEKSLGCCSDFVAACPYSCVHQELFSWLCAGPLQELLILLMLTVRAQTFYVTLCQGTTFSSSSAVQRFCMEPQPCTSKSLISQKTIV